MPQQVVARGLCVANWGCYLQNQYEANCSRRNVLFEYRGRGIQVSWRYCIESSSNNQSDLPIEIRIKTWGESLFPANRETYIPVPIRNPKTRINVWCTVSILQNSNTVLSIRLTERIRTILMQIPKLTTCSPRNQCYICLEPFESFNWFHCFSAFLLQW